MSWNTLTTPPGGTDIGVHLAITGKAHLWLTSLGPMMAANVAYS